MRALPKNLFKSMPWKNGGGETIEIMTSPEEAELDRFDWRVSMAVVACDGPFSHFPAIDRHLAILHGAGIALQVGDAPARRLTPASAAFAFAGDKPTSARLLDGPITDLNVMVRRGVWQAAVMCHEMTERQSFTIKADCMLLFAQQGHFSCHGNTAEVSLEQGDAVLLAPEDGTLLCVPEGLCRIWQIDLTRI